MPTHAAFLRAINVGGHNVKMDALRALCEACGLSNVQTLIASGNVIFESRAAAPALEKKIEAHLLKALGYEVATFLRSGAELGAVIARAESLLKKAKAANIYVGFLRTTPSAEQQARVQALASGFETFTFHGREVYWTSTKGFSDSKVSNAIFERITKSPATFRNLNTIRKVADKAG